MNRSTVALVLSLLAIVLASGPWIQGRARAFGSRILEQPLHPPFAEIAVHPARYDGALVYLSGSCRFALENVALYENSENARIGRGVAIWLDLTFEQFKLLEARTSIDCAMTGIYRSGARGHFGIFHGEIQELVWREPFPVNPDAV